MNVVCGPITCPVYLSSACVFYEGDNLVYTGITTNENLQSALQKIDAAFGDIFGGFNFQNGIQQLSPGDPVELGGSLLQNTTIGGAFTLNFSAGNLSAVNITGDALITSGGTSSDFVKGDGSLDGTSYQPSGSYITALTGDATASGPGSVVITLASVNTNIGTYGSGTTVPVITVNAKGLITSVVDTLVAFPSTSLSFGGDVTGLGNTGSLTTLTLQTVNANPFGVITPIKIRVNGKGLITGASALTNLDLDSIYGYTPVPNSRTLTINGITQNLVNDRTWTIPVGTVTSVSVTSGTGISASVATPTTTPNITITNTAPDQTVILNSGTGINVSGTYPNFTISSTTTSAEWGNITGTITDQTDLITYLSTNYTPQSRQLTINGVTYDLSANRSWTVSSGFINSISDTNTIDLTVTVDDLKADINYQNTATVLLSEDGSGLKADFASLNISQFTNDSGYLTSASLQNLTVSTGLQLNTGTTYNTSAARTISIDSTVVTLTGAQALSNKTGLISQWTNDSGYITSIAGAVTNVTGTTNRITSTGGSTPQIDISASYIGQSSITTLGTIGTGVWQGTAIGDTYISSSANWNTAYTNRITSLTTTGTSGAATLISNVLNIPQYTDAFTGTVTTVSVVTNQGVSGSVANATTTPAITLSLGALTGVTSVNGLIITANTGVITTGTWNASLITGTYGGTGVNNGTKTITLSGNLATTGAFDTTFASGFTGTITLPTATSTLATLALAETFTNKVSYNGLVITANTGAITTGTWSATAISAVKGGTAIDTSASTGVAQVTTGTWSVSTALANGTTATTQSAGDNSTKVATTAYVDSTVLTFWKVVPGTPVRVGNTSFTITDTANANLYNLLISRMMVLKWTDSGSTKMAMVVSATYATNNVTVTIMGGTLAASATMSTFKYATEKARQVAFSVVGTIGTGTDLTGHWQPGCDMKVFGVDGFHGTAGTTNATTYDINDDGTTMFTTKLSIASGATSGLGFTANDGIDLLAQSVVTVDCDSVSTTAPIDAYINLFLTPFNNQYLT